MKLIRIFSRPRARPWRWPPSSACAGASRELRPERDDRRARRSRPGRGSRRPGRREARAAGDARAAPPRRRGSRNRQIRRRRRCSARSLDELHAERRRHGVDADVGRARPDDDDPRPRALLRRHGAQEERRRHRDDELRHHRAGDGDLLRRHLQPVVHGGHAVHRRVSAAPSCRASTATSATAASAIPTRSRRRSPKPSICASR